MKTHQAFLTPKYVTVEKRSPSDFHGCLRQVPTCMDF